MRRLFPLLLLLCLPAWAQQPDRSIEAQRRALETERRALENERRALEAERRAGESRAAGGGTVPADPCLAANAQRQRACTDSEPNPLRQTPQCADALSAVRQSCSR